MNSKNFFFFVSVLILASQSCTINPPDVTVPCDLDEDFIFENDSNKKIDYTIDCETLITGDVVIEAGTVIEFTSTGSLIIDEGGSLRAIGTAEDHIIFRGTTDGLETWRGIYFESNSVHNILDFCEITNAGQEKWTGFDDPAAISIAGRASVTNSKINFNRGVGVLTDKDSEIGTIQVLSNNMFQNNSSYPVSMSFFNIETLDGTNEFVENGIQQINVKAAEFVGEDLSVSKTSIPYFVEATSVHKLIGVSNGIHAASSLTIEAGVKMLFDEGMGIMVAGNSQLKIKGTSNEKVELKAAEEFKNYWKGIFHNGLSNSNVIEHTIISGAASSSFSGLDIKTSLRLGQVGACCDQAFIKLDNVEFRDARCAIYKNGDKTTLEMSDVSFYNIDQERCD